MRATQWVIDVRILPPFEYVSKQCPAAPDACPISHGDDPPEMFEATLNNSNLKLLVFDAIFQSTVYPIVPPAAFTLHIPPSDRVPTSWSWADGDFLRASGLNFRTTFPVCSLTLMNGLGPSIFSFHYPIKAFNEKSLNMSMCPLFSINSTNLNKLSVLQKRWPEYELQHSQLKTVQSTSNFFISSTSPLTI